MKKIDKIDLKIMSALDDDAHCSLSRLAKKLQTSQQVISFRLQSLKKRGIISSFFTVIDFTKLGYTNYRTMIRFSNIDEKRHKEIIYFLRDHPSVLWIVDCSGRWDIIVNFMAKDIRRYNLIIREFINRFPDQIQNYDVLTTVELLYFKRDYFDKNHRKIDILPYFADNTEIMSLDDMNIKILDLISEDARLSSVVIANKLKLTPKTVLARIKEMKKEGIIWGFKPLIHLENTPYRSFKAFVKFQNITEQKEKQIIAFFSDKANVVGVIRMIGLWDFEVEIESESQEYVIKLTRDFRDRFKDIIKEFEIVPLFHEYKYNFFPRELVKKNDTNT